MIKVNQILIRPADRIRRACSRKITSKPTVYANQDGRVDFTVTFILRCLLTTPNIKTYHKEINRYRLLQYAFT